MSSVSSIFAVNLKKLREQSGLTQAQLAEIVGCTANHISAVERSLKFPSENLIDNIIEALGVKTFQLFIDEQDERNIRKKETFVEYVMDSLNKDRLKTLSEINEANNSDN